MAAVSLAAVLPLILAVALAAQNTSTSQIVITVVDQSGAVISGAHIGIVQLPAVIPNDDDWLHYASAAPEQTSTHVDGSGEATADLVKGSYAVKVSAPGFKGSFERIEVGNEPGQSLQVILDAAYGDLIITEGPKMLPEPTSLNIFIPLEPLQTISFTRPVRRRWMR
jgi:hypothetical protein